MCLHALARLRKMRCCSPGLGRDVLRIPPPLSPAFRSCPSPPVPLAQASPKPFGNFSPSLLPSTAASLSCSFLLFLSQVCFHILQPLFSLLLHSSLAPILARTELFALALLSCVPSVPPLVWFTLSRSCSPLFCSAFCSSCLLLCSILPYWSLLIQV